jgi:hypothetical protein
VSVEAEIVESGFGARRGTIEVRLGQGGRGVSFFVTPDGRVEFFDGFSMYDDIRSFKELHEFLALALEGRVFEEKRLYGRRGFTDEVLKCLGVERNLDYERFGHLYPATVTAEQLLAISKMVPEANWEDRQNEAPSFRAFVEAAEAEPRAMFEIYVVPEARRDERVTVTGAWLPAERRDLAEALRSKAKAEPDELMELERMGVRYVRMWWD